MNLKLFVEEDLLWKTFINMKGYENRMVSQGRLLEWNGIEWYIKGRNPTIMESY
jgi:hypothetical protein